MTKQKKKILGWTCVCMVIYLAVQYLLVLGPIYSLVGASQTDTKERLDNLEKRAKILNAVGAPIAIVVTVGGVMVIKKHGSEL